ncbi:type II secretion system F family protein [Nocardia farcinica]|uniref:type II secretion system F family protein n=1 Tax=Nocardia farcinica TaxID=37329 RepID=UPI001893B121|nr:type II secretion system F family protein [Nocardia farcinica]MBF6139032.1 type II secretion system F family protein [Nocardia farcinica]MBF6260035.1 type II secretion system F family protein [Nocardia farcinica]
MFQPSASVWVLLAGALLCWPVRAGLDTRLAALYAPAPPPPTRTVGPADPLVVASVFDLLAACLRAGLPMASAARAAAPGSPGELGAALLRAADLLALGADATDAWERAAREAAGRPGGAEIESLARMARRSARSGSSLAAAVAELAEQHRATVEDAAAARAERAGVLISGPLGLCFLPAFLCLGIVPVVVGLAGRLLDGGLL